MGYDNTPPSLVLTHWLRIAAIRKKKDKIGKCRIHFR